MKELSSDNAALPPLPRRLDQVCDRFESAWKATLAGGPRPRMEDFLTGVDGPELQALLRELLALEAHFRRQLGETPSLAEYQQRFPELPTGLAAHELALPEGGSLRRAFAGERNDSLPLAMPPGPLGDYELLEKIAQGGMGVVYKARHQQLNRLVALKILRAGPHADAQELLRFLGEAEVVARLQHPHIVQIYDVGQHQGTPYFTMELMAGGSLLHKLQGKPLPPVEAARVVEHLARGIDHAHQKGIVHRDLKPHNVLLGEDGAVKVSDFGLARRVELGEGLTQTGAVVGTPSYMAPEQASGEGKHVGPAADVYALGAVLYECLTGRPPFRAATTLETLAQVIDMEAAPPRNLNPATPRDLETICLKCLQKDPARRYPTAAELGDDLTRFVNGEPIRARPVGRLERARKWARRRPAVAGLLAVVALLTAGGLGGILWAYRLALVERDNALAAKEQTRSALKREEEQRLFAEQATAQANRSLYFSRMAQAHAEYRDGNVGRTEELLDLCPPGRLDWEWRFLKRLCHTHVLSFNVGDYWCWDVVYSPDGRQLATAATAGQPRLRLWDAETGQMLRTFALGRFRSHAVAFSPDGTLLAVACGDDDSLEKPGVVQIWHIETEKLLHTLTGHDGCVFGVAFRSDGKRLASISGAPYSPKPDAGLVCVWDVKSAKELLRFRCPFTTARGGVAWTPDGSRLATASGPVAVWQAASGARVFSLPNRTEWIAVSPDGKRIACALKFVDVGILDAADGKILHTCQGHKKGVFGLAFSPDGKTLASCGRDQTIRLWNVETGREVLLLRGHRAWPLGVAFRPDGKRLASCDHAGDVKVWDPASDPATLVRRHREWVTGLAFAPGGRQVVTASGAEATVWNCADETDLRRFAGPPPRISALALSADGHCLALGGANCAVWLRDAGTGAVLHRLAGLKGDVTGLAFSSDGALLAAVAADKAVHVWDPRTGKRLHRLVGHALAPFALEFQPGGTLLASLARREDYSYEIKFWDAAKGVELGVRRSAPNTWMYARALAFRADGRSLAVAVNQTIEVWDEASKWWDAAARPRLTLRGHAYVIRSAAFSPDGRRIASIGEDNTLRLWDAETGEQVLSLDVVVIHNSKVAFSPDGRFLAVVNELWTTILDGCEGGGAVLLARHGGPVACAACSSDGKTLAAPNRDGAVVLSDRASGKVRLTLKGRTGEVRRLAFSRDGQTLAASSADGAIQLWDLEAGSEPATYSASRDAFAAIAVAPKGRLLAAGGPGKTVCLWDLPRTGGGSLASPRLLTGHRDSVTCLAFSADGKRLASGGQDRTIRLYDATGGRELAVWQTGRPMHSLAFSPDDRFVAAGCSGGVEFWEVAAGRRLDFIGTPGSVASEVAFLPDGRTLLSANSDGTVRLHDVPRPGVWDPVRHSR